jgi:hypothetical protein
MAAGATLGTIAIIGVPTAIVLFMRFAHGTGDVLVERMVPADSAVYGAFYMDPPLSTKTGVRDFANRFPSVHGSLDAKISQVADSVLSSTGLKYDTDVKPWLGTQIGFFVEIAHKSASGALLLTSTDDARAGAALGAIHSAPAYSHETWSTSTYRGVTITSGSAADCSACSGIAYAIVDHVAVVADTAAAIQHAIDTDQGAASLGHDSLYKQTVDKLDSGRIAEVYAAAAPLVSAFKDSLSSADSSTRSVMDVYVKALEAYRSGALSVSIGSDHATLQVLTLTDPSKLPADASTAGASLLGWLPQSSVAAASGGINASGVLGALGSLGAAGAGPAAGFATLPPDVGLPTASPTASGADVARHLNGPYAVGVWKSPDGKPRGALLLTADDAAALKSALDSLTSLFAPGTFDCTAYGCTQTPQPTHSENHDGTAITVTADGSVAYAVVGSMGIIATGPAAVGDVLDAHRSGRSVLASSAFPSTGTIDPSAGLVWVDVQQTVALIRDSLTPSQRSSFDQQAAGDLAPLKVLTLTSSGDRSTQIATIQVTLSSG